MGRLSYCLTIVLLYWTCALLTLHAQLQLIGRIVDQKRCFLERPEWKTIPWTSKLTGKTVGDYLRDILCDIPGLMEDVKAVLTGQAASEAKNKLHDQLVETVQRTEQLRWHWGAAYPRACWEIKTDSRASVSLDAQGQPLFATSLGFSDVDRAVELVYFDAIQLMLYMMSDQVGVPESRLSLPAKDMVRYQGPRLNADLLPGQGDRESHALEICRTVDYFLQGPEDSKGAMILLFPMNVARLHLQYSTKVLTWIDQVLAHLAASKGWGSAQPRASSAS